VALMSLRHALPIVLVCALTGCHKKPTAGGVRLKQVNDALTSAGYKVDAFQPSDPSRFSAQTCAAGTLGGVDAVVCEFGNAEAVALGKKAAEGWVAHAVTGVVLANGNTLLALADRNRTDPSGKEMHKVAQAYTGTK
jgi:hypothetical protein